MLCRVISLTGFVLASMILWRNRLWPMLLWANAAVSENERRR
jgi:hypothetical protein